MAKFYANLRNVFTFDLRALALLRIGMAALILLDLSIRATDLRVFYSDDGILPLKTLFQHNWNQFNFCFHTASGLWQIQALLFIINGIFAFFLLTGYKTRISSFACWIFMLSLHNRNPLILQGGDDLFRMMLFWGMFLPWGKVYAVDSYHKPQPENMQVFNFATVGYLLQLLSVYFFAALLKTSPEWKSEGTALYYALSLDQMVYPIGKAIYPFPDLLRFLTLSTWYLELIAPLLFLIPFKNAFFRTVGILLIASLHIGISLTLFVGLFYLIGIVTLIGTLPKAWAEAFDKRAFRVKSALESFYLDYTSLKRKVIDLNYGFKSALKVPKLFRASLNMALGAVIAYTLIYNWHTLSNSSITYDNIQKMDWFGQFFKLNQKWGMFSPSVFKDDGWYIYEAETLDGQWIDLNREGALVDYEKPVNAVSLYKNDRWRKYGENFIFIKNAYMRPLLAEYLLKKWNAENKGNQVKSIKVIYMMEITLPDYQFSAPRKEELATYSN